MKRIGRVLCATDFSRASRRALATAVTIAKTANAPLIIAYVLMPAIPFVPDQYLDAATIDRVERDARSWSRRQLKRVAERLRKQGVRVSTVLKEGDAAAQIIAAAKSSGADLIVVGTHARHGLPKFFLGSVAQRVVASAPCPV